MGFLRAAYSDAEQFDFDGRFHQATGLKLAVKPVQRPHPPIWIETRDSATLEFCAKEGIHTGYFLLFPRDDAARRYRVFLENWGKAGWKEKPNIAYSTVVYVDETNKKALKNGLDHASQAYRGFLPPNLEGKALKEAQLKFAESFEARGEPGAAEIVRNLFDPDYLMANDLILVGSSETVAAKLKDYATEGMFNTFFAEFNFANLGDDDLMRSIRLFGTEVMPALRDFEPF